MQGASVSKPLWLNDQSKGTHWLALISQMKKSSHPRQNRNDPIMTPVNAYRGRRRGWKEGNSPYPTVVNLPNKSQH